MLYRRPPARRAPVRSTRPLLEPLEGRQLLATFTVTNVGDSGPGTLRQAILDADAASANGPGRIVFGITPPPVAFGGYPVVEIDPNSELPTLASGVVIDGTTQIGYVAADGPVVVLSGSGGANPMLTAPQDEGLVVSGEHAGVIGLTVRGFGGDQILLAGQHDFVQANRLGGGGVRLSHGFITGTRGGLSLLGSSQDFIQGNVMSSNTFGIFIGPGSSRDVFQSNFSQFNDYGLYSIDGTGNTIGSTTGNNTGNQFTNDDISGVVLIDTDPPALAKPQGNLIAGNVIAADGVLGFNGDAEKLGAVALISSGGNTIGGSAAAATNHIVNNFNDGLSIGIDALYAPNQAVAAGNLVQGNLIGGDPARPTFGGPQGPPYGNLGNAVVLGAGSANTAVLGNDLSYNGNNPVADSGRGNVTAGNTATHDGQRQVNFAVAVTVVPAANFYKIGTMVEVDFKVYNNGPGYADQAYLNLDFTAAPGLKFDSTSGAGVLNSSPTPTKQNYTFDASSRYTGPIPGTGWLPNDSATLRVFFTVVQAGPPASIQAIVGSGDSFDTNPNDKVDVLKLNLVAGDPPK